MYDLIIVGAGPVGLYTAKLCESLKVLVIEEHNKIGMPNHCSGLVSDSLADFFNIKGDWVENEVSEAILHSPNGIELKLKKHGVAYVINRSKFDFWLSKQVKSKIMLNTKVDFVKIKKSFVEVKTNKKTLKSKMIIGCDGSNSIVANVFGVKPKEILQGLIAIEKKQNYSKHVELFFDKKLTDGFLWKIPRGKTTEYGIFGEGVRFSQIESFFKINRYEKRAGMIPVCPPKTYFDRTLLIGDAAAQVKPWSGGGLIYGLTCAEIASNVILKAFHENIFDENFLKLYENAWKKAIGKQINSGLLFRKIYKKMNNRQIDNLFRLLKTMNLFSDFDWLDMDFLFLRKSYHSSSSHLRP